MFDIAKRPKLGVFVRRIMCKYSRWTRIICLLTKKPICSYSGLKNLYLELFSGNVNNIFIVLFYVKHACFSSHHTVPSDKLLKPFQFNMLCAGLLFRL